MIPAATVCYWDVSEGMSQLGALTSYTGVRTHSVIVSLKGHGPIQ